MGSVRARPFIVSACRMSIVIFLTALILVPLLISPMLVSPLLFIPSWLMTSPLLILAVPPVAVTLLTIALGIRTSSPFVLGSVR